MAGHLILVEPTWQSHSLPSASTKQTKATGPGSNIRVDGNLVQATSGAVVKQTSQLPDANVGGSTSTHPVDAKQCQRSRGRSRVR